MSRAAVREAVTNYIATAGIPSVGKVYRSRPKTARGTSILAVLGNNSGAVIIVHMAKSTEVRIAMGGPTKGEKFNKHTIALEILFQSLKPSAEQAQDDHDALIDALMTRLRADRTLGAPTVIWQSQLPNSQGIDLQLAEPVLGGQSVLINAVMTFQAWEYVSA